MGAVYRRIGLRGSRLACRGRYDINTVMKKFADGFRNALLAIVGWKTTSKPDNNLRRVFTRFVWIILLALLVSVLSPGAQGFGVLMSAIFVGLSVLYFATNVIVVLFLTSRTFRVDATRLFIDVATSTAFSVLSMASLHQMLGLTTGGHVTNIEGATALYFSIVTFTTLGFGDFAPVADLRIPSALHALVGNLHLGSMIGAAFLAASERFGSEGRPRKARSHVRPKRSVRKRHRHRPKLR